MNNKIIIPLLISLLALSAVLYFIFTSRSDTQVVITTPVDTSITYKNTMYGFTFSLPSTWQGYSVITDTWKGAALASTTAQSGTKLFIRNPKWTTATPYEDLPILVFTISQWDAYMNDAFSVSAAPIKASILERNNVYVFALPPRWDFDYSQNYQEAQTIIAGNPLKTFNLEVLDTSNNRLNTDIICEQVITYMTFVDAKSSATFITDCKEGKHPEVIEKYKVDMNLGEGATI